MDQSDLATLALIGLAAVIAPLFCDALRRFAIPSVVVEILIGILIGPQLLGIAHLSPVVNSFAGIGLAFLMFLAGYEVDFQRVKGRPLQFAVTGWVLSLGLAFICAAILELSGTTVSIVYIALALTTTALGTLLPILRDADELDTPFGSHVLAVGAAGEFLPIVAVALVLTGTRPARTATLLVGFTLVALATAAIALRSNAPRFVSLIRRHIDSSSQLPVRIVVLLVLGLVWLASELGLDTLLGAFAAGMVVRLANHGPDADKVRTKLDAVGFGVFVPLFFVVTGMRFDLDALLRNRSELLRVPLYLGLFLLIRGLPALLLYRRDLPRDDLAPLALFSATALPVLVVITSLGIAAGEMRPSNAAALVGAGMLSVLIYPQVAEARRRRGPGAAPRDAPLSGGGDVARGADEGVSEA